ncbi:alcohol oxidase [Amylostereum chailletii]|nr:alcohol oxidase [Amylostereum chailletii]
MQFPAADSFATTIFDFVIVGGGTAGLTLAARLTEDPDITVGIIEAGEDVSDMPEVKIPGMGGRGFLNPRVDWSFFSVPQAGANNRRLLSPRGKGIGGSSALNFMVYSRASAQEYDSFEHLGNPGWNWAEFLKYMKKAETYTEPPPEVNKQYHAGAAVSSHGTDGPLRVSYSPWFNELHTNFLDSLSNLGLPITRDGGKGVNVGAQTGMFTIDPDSATRSYAATAYYHPNAHRNNLVLLPGAQVTRVLFEKADDGDLFAAGVAFVKSGQSYTVKAKREVILSAGAFQTPQILELSGIGERETLDKFNIEQLINLPVGENLHTNPFTAFDHGWVPFVHEVSKNIETYDDPVFIDTQSKLYQKERRGILAGSFSGFLYAPLDKIMNEEDFATFQRNVQDDKTLTDTPGKQKHFDLLKKWFSDPNHAQLEMFQFPGFYSLGPLQRKEDELARYQMLAIIDLHPLSRGSVHICSSDPLAAPAIDPGYLKNPRDLDVLVHGVKFARKLLATEPYSSSQPQLFDPSAEVIDDEEALRDWCRNRVEPIYHPVGTASMLPKEDGGVVDHELRVYGTKNLRIVDASVLPLELSTHIQSTVYAIAEKAADIIKGAYL